MPHADAVRDLTADQLAISAGPDHAPIWALAAHAPACGPTGCVARWVSPAPRRRRFRDPFAELGWADDLDHPRSAAELVVALETTGAIIDRCLDTWIADMLETEFERRRGSVRQVHMRRSILLRLLSHDAFHSGEISQLLGASGLPAIDLWARRTTWTGPPAPAGDVPCRSRRSHRRHGHVIVGGVAHPGPRTIETSRSTAASVGHDRGSHDDRDRGPGSAHHARDRR